jgi:hypothetical protein
VVTPSVRRTAVRFVAGAVAALGVDAVAVVALAGCSRPSSDPAPASSAADLDPGRPLPSPVPEVVARVNGQAVRIQQILPMAKAELDTVSVADRDRRKPEVVRHAMQKYVDRELLLQEAITRGIQADAREVDWHYDQLRREHSDDAAWNAFLAGQGMDPQTFRAELRAQHTVAAMLEQELRRVLGNEPDPAQRLQKQAEVERALVSRLRAKARIEIFL